MNILKKKKRLIDWEEELNVWIPGINLEDHFIEYTKMEAFDKFNIGNTIYGWNLSMKMLYQHILNGFSVDINNYNEFQEKIFNLYQEKPLKDWENEYGIRIVDICPDEHDKFYFKRDFLKKLNSNFVIEKVRKDIINTDYDNSINHNMKTNGLIIKKRKTDVIRPKVKSLFDIVNVKRNKKNNNKLKKNIIKSSFAIALSIITAVSSYGITKALSKSVSSDYDIKVSSNVSNDNNLNSMKTCVIDNSLKKSTKTNYTFGNNYVKEEVLEVKKQENNQCNLILGSKIKLKNNSKIFSKINDCINDNNGLNPYFSSDDDRYIKCVTLDYNGNIIDSKNQKEIDNLISDGAKILVIGTSMNNDSNIADEGYYNYKDAKILCKTCGVL